jgi:hypothetical protein
MLTTMMRALAVALLFAVPHAALAQTPAPAQPASAPAQQPLNNAQLDALVAPIALYPDALLSEVLMASTYPLEVVEADRWIGTNKTLKGDTLKAALDKQSWDDSVKSLTATPDVLDMMSNQLSWTQQLGDAVLAQQPDIMDAIQRLRSKAQTNNKLASNKQQTVTTQQQGAQQVIVIAPTDPDTVYVPYYDPSVVYGAWPYPDYPAYPYYWPAPGYIAAGVVATGIAFGAGYALGRWVSNGNRWGGGFNWGNNNINVNRSVNNIGSNNWTHNPAHRQGVRYSNANVAAKFGGNRANISGGAQDRMDFRGRSGQQVLNPGGGAGANRPNIGGGAGAGAGANRPGGGNAAANRPGGGAGTNRPSGGGANRPGGGGVGTARPAVNRPAGGGGGGAMGNIGSGRAANVQSARGAASFGGGGGARMGGGGGGARMGGGGGGGARGGGGGGRRSDIRLKHDIVLLGHLDNGVGLYRFVYNGETRPYVGVMAQDVQTVRPDAVTRGADGYLRVYYQKLGLKFETYDAWLASGERMPVVAH